MRWLPSAQELWFWDGLCVLSSPVQQHNFRFTQLRTAGIQLWLFLCWYEPGSPSGARGGAVLYKCHVITCTPVWMCCTGVWTCMSRVWLPPLRNKHCSSCVAWEPGALHFHRLVGHCVPGTKNCVSLTLLSCWNNGEIWDNWARGCGGPFGGCTPHEHWRAQHAATRISYL